MSLAIKPTGREKFIVHWITLASSPMGTGIRWWEWNTRYMDDHSQSIACAYENAKFYFVNPIDTELYTSDSHASNILDIGYRDEFWVYIYILFLFYSFFLLGYFKLIIYPNDPRPILKGFNSNYKLQQPCMPNLC